MPDGGRISDALAPGTSRRGFLALLVPLLRRPRAQAVGLLRLPRHAHQRGRRAHGLLLRRPQGVLRPVLPDVGALLSAPAIALCATALVAGVTGAWSPCGFSMVETLGAAAERGKRRTTLLSCTTFAAGALLGRALTFGGLSQL